MQMCYICSNDDNNYVLSPCNHEFHAACLIDWFRINYTTFCPCCDNELLIKINPVNDFAKASRNARRQDYKDLFAKQKQNSKDIQIFDADHGAEFRLLRKRICGLRRKRRMLKRKIHYVKRQMCETTNISSDIV